MFQHCQLVRHSITHQLLVVQAHELLQAVIHVCQLLGPRGTTADDNLLASRQAGQRAVHTNLVAERSDLLSRQFVPLEFIVEAALDAHVERGHFHAGQWVRNHDQVAHMRILDHGHQCRLVRGLQSNQVIV